MLRGHQDVRDADGAAPLVGDGDLGLGVGPQPGLSTPAKLCEGPGEPVCEQDWQGHELRRLVGGVAEHDPLVPGALCEQGSAPDARVDLGGLLAEQRLDGDPIRRERIRRVRVADLYEGAARDALHVYYGAGAQQPVPFGPRCIPAGSLARPWKDKALPAASPDCQRGASGPSMDQVVMHRRPWRST
ncbi:MAG: hypothetical protein AMXMBFR64_36510 [Myxococcales bacterium]